MSFVRSDRLRCRMADVGRGMDWVGADSPTLLPSSQQRFSGLLYLSSGFQQKGLSSSDSTSTTVRSGDIWRDTHWSLVVCFCDAKRRVIFRHGTFPSSVCPARRGDRRCQAIVSEHSKGPWGYFRRHF